jgi:DNA primase
MDIKELVSGFDVITYLSENDVRHTKPGKNVSSGHIGMRCPFCDDHSNHFGISLQKKTINCFRCGTTGTVVDLVMELSNTGFRGALKVLSDYQTDDFYVPQKAEEKRKVGRVLPLAFMPIVETNVPANVKDWFERRRFPLSFIKKYRIGWCSFGIYAGRMIVPVFVDRFVVSFLAVDVQKNPVVKYKDCEPGRAIIPNKNLLYGVDWIVGKEIIIVEGLTDKMRVGDKALALFTKNFTKIQVGFLRRRFSRDMKVTVALDSDATYKGELLAKQLSVIFDHVIIAELYDGNDPDSLSFEDLQILKGEV